MSDAETSSLRDHPLPDGFGSKLSRRTLHDDLVGRLRDMIIEGHLPAGSRVHEGQVGAMLGVSRTPLREALKFLASEGLIDLVPGRGAMVRRLTADDVRQMLDVLCALEALAGRLACRNASDGQIAALQATHDRMMGFYAQRDRLEYYKLNQAIHSGIVAVTGNQVLASHHESLQSKLKRIRFLGNEGPAKWDGAVREHVAMMDALRVRDADRLAGVLVQHLEQTWLRVRDIL